VGLMELFQEGYKQGGLGLANTITSICNVSLLTFALRKKLGKLEMGELRATFVPLGIAVVASGLVAWGSWHLWERQLGHHNVALKIGAVFVPAILAGTIYWIIATLGKVPAAKEILDFVFRQVSEGSEL